VAGYDRDLRKVAVFEREGAGQPGEFVGLLQRPRSILMLVPAGAPESFSWASGSRAARRLIAETYNLMKRSRGLDHDELAQICQQWNDEESHSHLLEITAHIFRKIDEQTGQLLIDLILDEAKQKGTGSWTSEDALNLQVLTIDIAVAMRGLSLLKSEREEASHLLAGPDRAFQGGREAMLNHTRWASPEENTAAAVAGTTS